MAKRSFRSAFGSSSGTRKKARYSKRPTTSRIRRRRVLRFRRRSRSNRLGNYRYKQGNVTSLVKHIYIPGTVKRSHFAKSIYKQIGDDHYSRYYFKWNTATIAGPNQVSFMIGMPCFNYMQGTNASYAVGGGSTTQFTAAGYTWGSGTYDNFLITQERILLKHIRIRLVFNQVNENLRIRICLARMKRNTYPTQSSQATVSNTTCRTGWNESLDEPQNYNGWKVLYTKYITLDQPKYGTSVLQSVRTTNLYLPINRIIETANGGGVTPTGGTNPKFYVAADELAWLNGTSNSDYTFLHIDTNDATSSDSEYVSALAFFEWNWVGLD